MYNNGIVIPLIRSVGHQISLAAFKFQLYYSMNNNGIYIPFISAQKGIKPPNILGALRVNNL